MALDTLVIEPPPLRTDTGGVVRVGNTRVSLDSVVYAFNQGASVEEIVLRYPTLVLADTYAAISFYLNHRDEVNAYLLQRNLQAKELRTKVENVLPAQDIRDRLRAARTSNR